MNCKITLIVNWVKLWKRDRAFLKECCPNLTDKEVIKRIQRVRFWRFLHIFGIQPKLRTWERHYYDEHGNKRTIYFVNRCFNLKKLEKNLIDFYAR